MGAAYICFIDLKPSLDETSQEVTDVIEFASNSVLSRPGCQSLHWGKWVEKADRFDLVFGFDSMEDIEKFVNGDDGVHASLVSKIAGLTDGKNDSFEVYQMAVLPTPRVFDVPCVELGVLYPKKGINREEVETKMAALLDGIAKLNPEPIASLHGWVEGSVRDPEYGMMHEGYAYGIGWPDPQTATDFSQTKASSGYDTALDELTDGRRRLHHVAMKAKYKQ